MAANIQAEYFLKLRRNITLESDLLLARLELEAFLDDVDDVMHFAELARVSRWLALEAPCLDFEAFVRDAGQQGYQARGPLTVLPELIRRLSFIQTIYCLVTDSPHIPPFVREMEASLGPVIVYKSQGIIAAVPHYALMELADVVTRRARKPAQVGPNLDNTLNALLGKTEARPALKLAKDALAAQSITSHLTHDIHYYKAKFFPRMARALLNISACRLGGGDSLRVIDNFAGSGTTLLEAALMGITSVGLDIDPLSTLIARTKVAALALDSDLVTREVGLAVDRLKRLPTGQLSLFDPLPDSDLPPVTFPDWLLKNRKMTPEIAAQLIDEMTSVRRVIAGCDEPVRDLFRVLLSDAINRRIRFRFLGIGVGRFSLMFSKKPLVEIFAQSLGHYAKVITACDWLCATLNLPLAAAQVIQADTRHIPESLGQFDMLLTSPPYLPASSGRESYAKARAPSLIALGMTDDTGLDTLADDAIGSMKGAMPDLTPLTDRERDLVTWLQNDDLRAIKAEPTARYFLDMRRTFQESFRCLRPGGRAVIVSGKQNVFYRYATRDVLYMGPTAEMLAEEAQRAGFVVDALHDMPLKKRNINARPRSRDDYAETLIMLQKPS